jgi:hypothetical protein
MRPKVLHTPATRKPAPLRHKKSLAELSARFDVPPAALEVAVAAAQELPADVVKDMSRWIAVLAGLETEERRHYATSIATALEAVGKSDPLEETDAPLALREHLQAEQDVQASRGVVLRESLSADDAAAQSGRSRQNLEALRRNGQAIALRVGNQWRYPAWQFDPDCVGGIVRGIGQVVAGLRMSPAGAALWLIQPSPLLGGARPIALLRKGLVSRVVQVAEELGHAP